MFGIAGTAVIAFFVSLIVSYVVLVLSRKFHIFIDETTSTKPQKFHSYPTPRAGGVGIFLSFGLVGLSEGGGAMYFLLGLAIIFLSGFLEDFSASLSPKTRLLMQLLGTCVSVLGMGAVITDLSPIVILPYALGVAFSLFGIIGVCNAINIIDGFNGLAGGICAMAFGAIGLGAYHIGDGFVLFVALIGLGATLGFLCINFPKGKIFLGDGGAYVLGFVLAILLAVLTQKTSELSAWFGLAVMIYPVWEVVFSIFRKKLKKYSPMQPDKEHFHQLIYQKVHSNPLTALIMWLFNLPFMVLAVIFMHKDWVLIGLCVLFILLYSLIYYQLKRN
ncbi:hypothetical protein BKH46_02810 [Helicobacter sp. 12S02634-8]|nr:hypothetical protein BKH46_02810 [Helicobacter sp. 12S02634-8]